MKDGIVSVEIEPFNRHLSFQGPVKTTVEETFENATTDHSQLLKGHIRLLLSKAVKIKSISVKFKGESLVNNAIRAPHNQFHTFQQQQQYHPQQDLSTPILPKLKQKVLEKSTLVDAGVHLIPWELEIPDVYPRSFSSKGGAIRYKVELKMSVGYNKVITTSRPVVIHRHLLPSRETALRINVRSYEHVVQKKFLFELEIPKMVCIDQGYIPINVMFKCIDKVPVKFINTQLIQVEIYRCRNVSKSEIDMAVMSNKKCSTIVGKQAQNAYKNSDTILPKFFKRTRPVVLNTIDLSDSFDSVPLILKHQLDHNLPCTIDSPLIIILYQLEITFNFGQGLDEVRAKIPIQISTVSSTHPMSSSVSMQSIDSANAMFRHVFERRVHKRPLAVELADHSVKRSDSLQSSPEEKTTPNPIPTRSERGLRRLRSAQSLLRGRSGSLPMPVSEAKDQPVSPVSLPPMPMPVMARTSSLHGRDIQLNSNGPVLGTKTSNELLRGKQHTQGAQPSSIATFPSATSNAPFSSPFNTFPGLPPPPRRSRTKREPSGHTQVQHASKSILPKATRSASESNIFSSTLSVESPLLSPLFPMQHTHTQSPKPSAATVPSVNKRTSSLDTNLISNEPTNLPSNNSTDHIAFAYMIASHYLESSLPQSPTHSTISTKRTEPNPKSKPANRMTKVYYEESDDDDDDDEEDMCVKIENEREPHTVTC